MMKKPITKGPLTAEAILNHVEYFWLEAPCEAMLEGDKSQDTKDFVKKARMLVNKYTITEAIDKDLEYLVSTFEKLHKLKKHEDIKLCNTLMEDQLSNAYIRAADNILMEVKKLSCKPSSYLLTQLIEKISKIFLIDEEGIIEFLEEPSSSIKISDIFSG
jgi:hypothetical protein